MRRRVIRAVFDASAVLALLKAEAGGARVLEFLPSPAISTVNLCEVVTKTADDGVLSDAVEAKLKELALQVVPFDEKAAYAAGVLHSETRRLGLSLADCACLTLARWMDAPAITADRLWREVDDVEVVVIR